jgi:hypothetical protein
MSLDRLQKRWADGEFGCAKSMYAIEDEAGEVLDGMPLVDLIAANADTFMHDDVVALVNLKEGDTYVIGGGAAPLFIIRRIPSPDPLEAVARELTFPPSAERS